MGMFKKKTTTVAVQTELTVPSNTSDSLIKDTEKYLNRQGLKGRIVQNVSSRHSDGASYTIDTYNQ